MSHQYTGRVFVVQQRTRWDAEQGVFVPVHDTEPARTYGRLVVLFTQEHDPLDQATCVTRLRDMLASYEEATDMILPIGDPLLIALTCFVLIQLHTVTRVTFLRWHRGSQKYRPFTYTLSTLDQV